MFSFVGLITLMKNSNCAYVRWLLNRTEPVCNCFTAKTEEDLILTRLSEAFHFVVPTLSSSFQLLPSDEYSINDCTRTR